MSLYYEYIELIYTRFECEVLSTTPHIIIYVNNNLTLLFVTVNLFVRLSKEYANVNLII